MPVTTDRHLMQFHRTNCPSAPATNVPNAAYLDPNSSLGGFRARQTINIQSTLTAAMTQLGTLVDSTQVQAVPAGPIVYTSPNEDSGTYRSSANLVAWYRPSVNPYNDGTASAVMSPGMGFNYAGGAAWNEVDLDSAWPTTASALGLTIADVDVAQQPGHFDDQRGSVYFNSTGTGNNQGLRATALNPLGMANAWSIFTWVRPDSIGAITSTILHIGAGNGITPGVNGIKIRRNTATLRVVIVDQTTATNTKDYTYNGFFAANTWVSIGVTWDGTTLSVYKNGTLVAPD